MIKTFIRVNERVSGLSRSRIKLRNEYINIKFITSIKFKDNEVELWLGDARNNQTRKYIINQTNTIDKIRNLII